MKGLLSYFLIITVFIFFSCDRNRKYRDEEFIFDEAFIALFNSASMYDTVHFRSQNSNKIKTFIISYIDSFAITEQGSFINSSPFKRKTIHFSEIISDTTSISRRDELTIIKNPNHPGQGIEVQFNDLYYSDTILPPLIQDTIFYWNKPIGYYKFMAKLSQRSNKGAKAIILSPKFGFLGFETGNGDFFIRCNVDGSNWNNNESK